MFGSCKFCYPTFSELKSSIDGRKIYKTFIRCGCNSVRPLVNLFTGNGSLLITFRMSRIMLTIEGRYENINVNIAWFITTCHTSITL